MILGIGIDAAYIERSLKLNEHARRRIFHPAELEDFAGMENAAPEIKAQFLASRFAVKEAYAKARGTGFCETVVPSEIRTCSDDLGKPYIKLYGKTLENAPKCSIFVSLTHQEPLAVAVVVLEAPYGDSSKDTYGESFKDPYGDSPKDRCVKTAV